MKTFSNVYPIIKTVYKFVLAGCWTDADMVGRVKVLNEIPLETNHRAVYDPVTNITIITISTTAQFD